MKKFKFLSFILTIALVFNFAAPIAYATESNDGATLQMNTPVTNGAYTMSGAENTEVRFNILINTTNQTGQFAIVYLDSPDYMYELTFDLDDATANTSNIDFANIQAYCFNNENQWNEVYLPSAVTVVETDENQLNTYAANSDSYVTYFENWLKKQYGREYSGKLWDTKTQDNTKMYLKTAFNTYAHRDHSYLISQTMTVTGFVTSVLGLASGSTAVQVIGVIASAGGILTMGNSVHEYILRANWSRYATVVSGTGYPYGLTNRYMYYTGYAYTETGSCNVDTASSSVSYVPSSTVYRSKKKIFNNAFDEYKRIGFQEGNF